MARGPEPVLTLTLSLLGLGTGLFLGLRIGVGSYLRLVHDRDLLKRLDHAYPFNPISV